jgi:hypothetical protein
MRVAARCRRGGADRDVGARGRIRVAREQDDAGQPQRSEDEPDRRPEVSGGERDDER